MCLSFSLWIMIIIRSLVSIHAVAIRLQCFLAELTDLIQRSRFGQGVFLGGPMGHSKAEKVKTHKRIVALASKRFREEGLAGVGIAELMKQAGLTVGGFYKHFASRDNLAAEAPVSALEMWKRQINAAASGGPEAC
jgi:hypothetical protein